ncbi:hypothetical protein QM359_06130 [Streptococcus infantis]|jgi:hypothetical protein|uniref:hypothetical protein n=1 Tax=Streptococcus infantis TaxID=68892 RepID=UPI0039C2381F
MDKKELQELEDEHNRKLRGLERLEMDLDDYYHKFSRETDTLLEELSNACKDNNFAEIQPYIYEIENNLDSYHQEYKIHIEDVLEARYRENKNYCKQMEERKV